MNETPATISLIRDQSDIDLQLAAVKIDGLVLRYIHHQTERVCLVAIKQNPEALKYVHNQTDKICLVAVNKDPNVLKYVRAEFMVLFVDEELDNVER